MSSESPQAKAAGQQAEWQAMLAGDLSRMTMPELQALMGPNGRLTQMLNLDSSGRMSPDSAIRSSAMSQLQGGYDQAQRGSQEAIQYGALRGGFSRTAPGAVDSSIMSAATSLDRDQASAMRNLEFMSAQSSLKDYNQVLSLLGQGTNTALGLAQGFSGAAGSAIGGLSGQSQFGSTLGGATAGAGLGASVGGLYGAAIGGVAGGVAGYLGAG